ncbi:MAG: hypothetical protein IKO45_03150 [Clostridia bacterium]|nr:hypothetical protein [Clostridia bacterium]
MRRLRKHVSILIVILTLFFCSCSKKEEGSSISGSEKESSAPVSEPETVPDTEGIWVSKDGPLMGVLVAGCIGYGKVEIYGLSEEEDEAALIWSGDLNRKEMKDGKSVFISVNDHERTDISDYGVTDETVELMYSGGEISFTTKIMGFPQSFTLVPYEDGTQGLMEEMVSEFTLYCSPKEPVTVTSSEYTIYREKDGTYFYYLVSISNPNPEYAVCSAMLRVVYSIGGGEEKELFLFPFPDVAPDDTLVFGGMAQYEEESDPSEVRFEVELNKASPFSYKDECEAIRNGELEIREVEELGKCYYKGWIYNTSRYEVNQVRLLYIYRKDGKIVVVDAHSYPITIMRGRKGSFRFETKYPKSGFDFDEVEIICLDM